MERLDKIFIDPPFYCFSRRIKISPKAEVSVFKKNATAFAAKGNRIILQPRQTSEYFVFPNYYDGGIIISHNAIGFWMIRLTFEESLALVVINCHYAENIAGLRIPKQFSAVAEMALRGGGVKKLTPPPLKKGEVK